MGDSLLNFFDLRPLNTSNRALNINLTFRDTLYIKIQMREISAIATVFIYFSFLRGTTYDM